MKSSVTNLSGSLKVCNQLKTIIFEPNSQVEYFGFSFDEFPLDTICIQSNANSCCLDRIKNLKNVIIPPDSKLKEIKSLRSTAIESITIPQQLENLGNSCFSECRNLKSLFSNKYKFQT